MHLTCGDLALANSLIYFLSQLVLLLGRQLLGTIPVVMIERLTVATATPAHRLAFLLVLLEDVEDLLGVHVVEPLVEQTDRLTVPLGHGNHDTGWVALRDG